MSYPPEPYQPPDPYRPIDPYQPAPPPPDPTIPYSPEAHPPTTYPPAAYSPGAYSPGTYSPSPYGPSGGTPPPPYGGGGYGPPPAYSPPPGYSPPPDKSPFGASGYGAPYGTVQNTNVMAIASLVCSILGMFTCISAPVGVVLGHIAKAQIRQTREAGEGLAVAGLWVGYLVTVAYLAVIVSYAVGILVVFAGGTSTTF